ncbi:MAG TPA: HAD-IC family P-type ATPase, partial [Candidatus Bathyarchaeia archaeon]|nr:HAD-IC family P-type ATPase [Candidatus Bathyarchaeia archaeon]
MRSPSPTARRRAAALAIPLLAIAGIAVHLALGGDGALIAVLVLGGVPLLVVLARKLLHGEIGADLLAGISIVTAAILGEYLAGAIVVLMLSGGEALEKFAVARASSVLRALAARMPSTAHRKTEAGLVTIEVSSIAPGDEIVVLAHEICPVDGVVIEGHGAMDEAYLTGEPYVQSKAKGSTVLSGAVNGDHALTVRATRRAQDSRYAAIVEVMRRTEESRPRLRRLGDRLGAIYTPVAIACAAGAYFLSGSPTRALSVLVVATPCPLILAIPVAIIGGISLAARRGIVVRDPAVLERLDTCRTAIFDKTGTLTYGKPVLTELVPIAGFDPAEAVLLAGSLERYSKHPLAAAVVEAARQRGIDLVDADEIAEPPGQGLSGLVLGRKVALAGRRSVAASLPPSEPGL